VSVDPEKASPGKAPRTARGRETLRRLLDAAAAEFGERGFHEASISGITRRGNGARQLLYLFRFEGRDLHRAGARHVRPCRHHRGGGRQRGSTGLVREREALEGFLRFAREHKEIYRIIDEAEFADPQSYRAHYEGTAQRIAARLDDGVAQGTLRAGDQEVRAWALMGMNVFLGLRFGVWDASRPVEDIAGVAADLLRDGLSI
jgi:AcrR family transcriptional regulator